MPRFFFNHTTKTGEREVDIDGLKLDSLNSAIEEASFAAQGAVSLAEQPAEGVFEIEDEGRVLVARVPYIAAALDEEPPAAAADATKPE